MPRRLKLQAARRVAKNGDRPGHVQISAEGNVFVNSKLTNNTVNLTSERSTFADDLMPATLTAIPVLLILLLLSFTGQTLILRSIVEEGNAFGLATLLLPLFLPTIAASLAYLAVARGWTKWDLRTTNGVAATLAATSAMFVPINYLALQLAVFGASLWWIRIRHRRPAHRRRLVILTTAVLVIFVLLEGIAESAWPRYSLSRVIVGRVLDGLTRLNLGDPPDHSVLVVSVNDAYAIVASTDYPPKVQSLPPAELEGGQICQLRHRWNQQSLIQIVSRKTHAAGIAGYCIGGRP